jgi:hypothetical protein
MAGFPPGDPGPWAWRLGRTWRASAVGSVRGTAGCAALPDSGFDPCGRCNGITELGNGGREESCAAALPVSIELHAPIAIKATIIRSILIGFTAPTAPRRAGTSTPSTFSWTTSPAGCFLAKASNQIRLTAPRSAFRGLGRGTARNRIDVSNARHFLSALTCGMLTRILTIWQKLWIIPIIRAQIVSIGNTASCRDGEDGAAGWGIHVFQPR